MGTQYSLILFFFSASILAAGLPETRVIHYEGSGTLKQRVINADTAQMLIHVWADDDQEKKLSGIVVAPNVFVMPKESERVVKILN